MNKEITSEEIKNIIKIYYNLNDVEARSLIASNQEFFIKLITKMVIMREIDTLILEEIRNIF